MVSVISTMGELNGVPAFDAVVPLAPSKNSAAMHYLIAHALSASKPQRWNSGSLHWRVVVKY